MSMNQRFTPPPHSTKPNPQRSNRPTNWIDWMKTLGMFFIIWGHLSPSNLNDFIYSFSVPSFFMISGYLFKPLSWTEFFKNNFHRLIIPYLLLCGTLIVFFAIVKAYFDNLDIDYFYGSAIAMLIGDQNGLLSGIGCQALWFVYTLFLVKCAANYLKSNWGLQFVMVILMLLTAYYVNNSSIELFSSWANVTLAYPFFISGLWLKKYCGHKISASSQYLLKHKLPICSVALVIIGIVTIYVISLHNGMVKMYNAQYGHNIILCLFGGFLGTLLLAYVGMLLGNCDINNIIKTISTGTMIILAWQIVFFVGLNLLLPHTIGDGIHDDFMTAAISIAILIIFVPIVKAVNRYLPVLNGYRMKK